MQQFGQFLLELIELLNSIQMIFLVLDMSVPYYAWGALGLLCVNNETYVDGIVEPSK